jgi:hypothetical protein
MTPYRPIGGRGHKESYETKVIRVPTAVIPYVDDINDRYYDAYLACKSTSKDPSREALKALESEKLNQQSAIEAAYKVLALKKSAKVSVEKLLQVIYGDDSIKL